MSESILPELGPSWMKYLSEEFDREYMLNLKAFLYAQKSNGKIIYPAKNEIFQALNTTPFNKVKVVIIGQDPYHGEAQAHGMCFSVKEGIKTPPSLLNIYKELHSDINFEIPAHGYLMNWAKQGVLLLNDVLTVEKAKAHAHKNRGWENFTDKVIEIINQKKTGVIFLLWGSPAQKKGKMIDENKHYVLKAPHPSPLSSYRGFFGCKHFSKTNKILKKNGIKEIDWSLPNI